MRLCAATVVRNEGDVIEAFVRHNLAFLDHLAIVDHGSTDDTPDVLAALAREGLPITLRRDDRVAFLQPEILTPLARELLAMQGAAFVFMLDADEFVATPSRIALERVLARVPPGVHALANWRTYVPDFVHAPASDLRARLASARCVPDAREAAYKVIVGRHFLDTPTAFVAMGNHRVFPSDDAPHLRCPHVRLPDEAAAVAHVPIRSAAQLTTKVAIGWLAHLAAGRGNAALSFHWGEAYARLAAGESFNAAELTEMAANYSVPRAQWRAPDPGHWTERPFLAPFQLRYTVGTRTTPLATVLRFAERLAVR